ncbi:MAG: hypothetical protein SFU83_06920 [Meiothermus sp.]|nr:hypothetical protein [Meiothermus sp.]
MPQVNLNYEPFLQAWFALEKPEQLAMLKTIRKILALSWDELYKDSGLNWELATQRGEERFYSIRITQKCRALVQREGNLVVFVSLHPDHDSAYR